MRGISVLMIKENPPFFDQIKTLYNEYLNKILTSSVKSTHRFFFYQIVKIVLKITD